MILVDIKLFLKKLKSSGIAVTDAKIYAMPNIHQVYFFDPNANIIEVNQNINWIEISFIHPLNKFKNIGNNNFVRTF